MTAPGRRAAQPTLQSVGPGGPTRPAGAPMPVVPRPRRADDPVGMRPGAHRLVVERAAQLAASFLDTVHQRPVAADTSREGHAALVAELGGPLPEIGERPTMVLDSLARCAPHGVVASTGPRFGGFVTGGAHPAARGAKILVEAGWDPWAGTYEAAPAVAVAEQIALDWAIELFGLDGGKFSREISGGFVGGTTEGHIVALAAAAYHQLKRRGHDVIEDGLWGAPRLDILVGEDVHVSVEHALGVLGMGRAHARRVPTELDGTMRVDALERELERCAPGPIVCAQLGAINTGACDPLDRIVPLVHARGGWVHVDGAFGLWAAACPELAHLTYGVEAADSWATDFHKMGQTAFGCGAVFTAHPEAHVTAMSTRAAYTTVGAAAGADRRRDGMDYALGMARTGNGVSAYAALRALGRVGVTEVVRRCHSNAVMLAKLLDGQQGIVTPFTPVLNQVLIDCAPSRLDDRAAHQFIAGVCRTVQANGETWIGGTTHKGRPMARYSVTNGATTEYDVKRTAQAIIAVVGARRADQLTAP